MRLRSALLSFTVVFLVAGQAFSGTFTLGNIVCDAERDSLILKITGEGTPEFESYSLENPSRAVIEILNGVLPKTPLVRSFAEPVKKLEIQSDGIDPKIVRIACELTGETGFDARTIEGGIEVAFAPVQGTTGPGGGVMNDDRHWLERSVNIDLDKTPLKSALSLLARQNAFDIVLPEIEGTEVSAQLKGATVKEALEALLGASGYTYYTTGKIVVVKSLAEEAPGEFMTRIFHLEYVDARQIEKQVKNMLSNRGKVEVVAAGHSQDQRQDSGFPAKILAVTDLAYMIPVVEEFIARVDVRPRQVAIDVKLVETGITDEEAFGLDWSKSISAKVTGAEEDAQSTETVIERLSMFSTLPIESGSFSYGTLNISEVSLLLESLQSTGKSKLLSNPSVTTSDGKPAMIDVVTTIPIQTINRFSEGAVIQDIVTYQYKDVGITLEVTPRVNKDGYISLDCRPTVEEITGWVGPADNRQPITSKRSVRTDVVVKNGETLVIGGLMKEGTIETVEGIWLLSDIPVIGEIFKHRSKQNSKTDLMILITPSVFP
jgi:type II secretory pathway component GspD/PulD (secretin)